MRCIMYNVYIRRASSVKNFFGVNYYTLGSILKGANVRIGREYNY